MKNTQALVSDGKIVSLFGFQGAGSRIPNSNQSPAKRVCSGEETQESAVRDGREDVTNGADFASTTTGP